MIIPMPALWFRQAPEDPNDQIDRALYNRNHRLIAGLSVDQNFESVHGVLAVSVGNGKYIRLQHTFSVWAKIPKHVAQNGRSFIKGPLSNASDLAPLLADLAEVQASVVEKLKCHAGKYVDRVMAVAVCDPGFWVQDFDGNQSYTSLCDPTRLAELSGVTVIDSFPSRDLVVGGRGNSLDAIPMWMMLADRNSKVANQQKAVLIANGNPESSCNSSRGYWLPPSDGLDSDVPEIQSIDAAGFGFLQRLVARHTTAGPGVEDANQGVRSEPVASNSSQTRDIEKVYASGQTDQQLYVGMMDVLNAQVEDGMNATESRDDRLDELANRFLESKSQHETIVASLIRTSVVATVDHFAEKLLRLGQPDEIIVSAVSRLEACVVNQLQQVCPQAEIQSITKTGFPSSHLQAVVAAVLGLLHIDQMPANVPWLTGAQSQRILGRLTPGRPANWRQLVRVMADFHPPAMKLRDAV